MKITEIIRRPLVTEKTVELRESADTLVFEVAMDATKMRDSQRGREAVRRQGGGRPHVASRTAR